MNEEKQIHEMSKIIGDCYSVSDDYCDKFNTCAECKAMRVYNAGYRKASELTTKIFDEIEMWLISLANNPILVGYSAIKTETFAELRKKFEKGQDNEDNN